MQANPNTYPGLIFLNTLPKSGSMFIWNELSRMTNFIKARISVTQGTFPDDLIDPERIKMVRRANCACQAHVPARYKNLIMMECHDINKVVIHIRDPRQAVLSWTHHVDKLKESNQSQVLRIIEPRIPDDYFDNSLDEKIDFQLKTMFPIFVKWIHDWLNADKVDGVKAPEIHMTSFEKFKQNQTAYFNDIFAFHQLPHRIENAETVTEAAEGQSHFRQGTTDEWRGVFNDRQKAEVATILSQYQWPDLSQLHMDLSEASYASKDPTDKQLAA